MENTLALESRPTLVLDNRARRDNGIEMALSNPTPDVIAEQPVTVQIHWEFVYERFVGERESTSGVYRYQITMPELQPGGFARLTLARPWSTALQRFNDSLLENGYTFVGFMATVVPGREYELMDDPATYTVADHVHF